LIGAKKCSRAAPTAKQAIAPVANSRSSAASRRMIALVAMHAFPLLVPKF
jgi:hypothetical protein